MFFTFNSCTNSESAAELKKTLIISTDKNIFGNILRNNFAKSLKFYKDLGFKTHNYKKEDDVVFFEMEGTWLSLFPRGKLAEDATVSPDGNGFRGITLAHNVSSKEDVDKVFKLAVSVGAKPVKKPQDVFWGGYSGYFADPDGHLWEVAYNPFTDLS